MKKKTSKDSNLFFFGFFHETFFPRFELLNTGCNLFAGVYGTSRVCDIQ